VAAPTLAESWAAALATLPSDWSDVYAELELTSRDDVDQAALFMAPINPRLDPTAVILRFRSARVAGYGGSPGMVARCFERCDGAGIAGEVRIVRAISGSRGAGTQGPVWQIAGRTV
jgi:hypothetical protein